MEGRPKISDERLAMQADYFEAQLKFILKDLENATKVARNGLARAEHLGAKEDQQRLRSLLQNIKEATQSAEDYDREYLLSSSKVY